MVQRETGVELELPVVSTFRDAVMNGNWIVVLTTLPNLGIPKAQLKFAEYFVFEQIFLELCDNSRRQDAFRILREKIMPKYIFHQNQIEELTWHV